MKTLRGTMLISLVVLSLLVVPVAVYAKHKHDHDDDKHHGWGGSKGQVAALQAEITALQNQVGSLTNAGNSLLNLLNSAQNDIKALQTRVQTLESNGGGSGGNGLDLSKYVTIDTNPINGLAGPHLIFTGVNVHIRSGSGFTDDNVNAGGMLTGLGNLVVGYNELLPGQGPRGGSHNIVGGMFNSFPTFGGLVVGRQNMISGQLATVTGGFKNEASGALSSILGGQGGSTTGLFEHIP